MFDLRAGRNLGIYRIDRVPAHRAFLPDQLPDLRQRLLLFRLTHHDREECVFILIPVLDCFLALYLKRHLDVHLVVQPVDVLHSRQRFDPLFIVECLRNGNIPHHHPQVWHRLFIGFVHHIKRDGGGRLIWQIVDHIIVGPHLKGHDPTEHRRCQKQD